MIAPSLLSADFTRLSAEIELIEKSGADILHLDIMDGHFVPNITFGPMIVKQIRRITSLPLDVHLMIDNPELFADEFIDAGADYLTVHQEATAHLHRLITHIKDKGVKAGISINPATSICTLEEVISIADMVLVMTVNPGFGGQKFISAGVNKVKKVKELINFSLSKAVIEVDGGVNDKTAPLLWDAGADILVAGSYVFGSQNYAEAISSIRRR